MTFFHPTAIVSSNAKIGENCYIGAFSIIGDEVELGKNVRLESHVVVDGKTFIDDETKVFPFVSIGLAPQDLKYGGEITETRIGKRNQIREFVTIHRGTANRSSKARPVLVLGVDSPTANNAQRHDLQVTGGFLKSLPEHAREHLTYRLVDRLEPINQGHSIEGLMMGEA